jgi:tripartite ATP-independent transporter DctM subunit
MIAVFCVFLVLLVLGVPVAFAIGMSGLVFFFQHSNLLLITTIQLPITQTQNVAMLAIPLFIFAGNIMNEGGVTKRLIILAGLLTGHMRGGLAQVSVMLSALMGGVSGSATADAAMEARLLGKDMLARGYAKGFSANVITFTSLVTATIPPGVGLIIYGTTGSVSIGRLFMSGLIVGLLMMAALMATVAVLSRIYHYRPERAKRATAREICSSLKETIWALLFPLLLLAGIRMGFFTPSEVGAFACAYAFLVGKFVYKELDGAAMLRAMNNSVVDIGAVMLIVSMTGLFGYGIPIDKIPQKLTALMLGITTEPALILIFIIALLVFIGMFMEGSVVILLLTPILLPMCKSVGIDPVHLGLLMCTTITMGVNTPPVGMSMYTVNTILDCPLNEYVRHMWPFMFTVLLFLGMLAFFPEVVITLPNMIYGR